MTTSVFLAPLSVAGGPLFIPGTVSPAAGGQLFTYITGTSTKLPTYTTSSGAVANANPIVLDSGGFITGSGEVWLIQSSSYRFILAPSTDTDPPASPYWTRDSISGINDVQTQINTAGQEWIASSTTPVFSNASTFVITGDQRSVFSAGRRVKTTNSGGTVYGTITSSVFVTSTTVFVTTDSGNIDSGLSAVSYGLLSTPDGSMPWTNVSSNGLVVSTAAITVGSSSPTLFGMVVRRKPANENVSSTISLHSDADLIQAIGANQEWIVDYDVTFENTLSATGLQFVTSSMAGATTRASWQVIGNYSTNAFFSGVYTSDGVGSVNLTQTVSSCNTALVMVRYYILNSSTAGNLLFRWGPTTSVPTVLSAREGSSMKAYRIT